MVRVLMSGVTGAPFKLLTGWARVNHFVVVANNAADRPRSPDDTTRLALAEIGAGD
jgi:hypothetical protein